MKRGNLWSETVVICLIMAVVITGAYRNGLAGGTAGRLQEVNEQVQSEDSGQVYDFSYLISGEGERAGREQVSYSDSFLQRDNSKYDPELAQVSLALAMTGFKKEFAGSFLSDLGYEETEFYRYDEQSDEDKAACVFARKKIGGAETIVICVRGGKYGDEWGSNGRISKGGSSGYHYGFHVAADDLMGQLAEYAGKQGIPLAEARVWITGFSRGAACANVLGARLQEYDVVAAENIYCYTFAAPSTVSAAIVREKEPAEGVYNIVNPADIVTHLPMNISGSSENSKGRTVYYSWDYVKYGSDVRLPADRADMEIVGLLEKSLAYVTRNEKQYVSKYQDDVIIPLLKEYMGTDATETDRQKIISAMISAMPGVKAFLLRELNELDLRTQVYIGNMLSGAEEQRLLAEHRPETYWYVMEKTENV